MQSIREVSNTEGIPTIFFPLGFIVFISMLKDCFEDYKRKRSDQSENNKEINVFHFGNREVTKMKWSELKVGDIIRLDQDQYVPADLLVLCTSEPKGFFSIC